MTPVEAAAKALYEANNARHGGKKTKWENLPQEIRDMWMRDADIAITAYLQARTVEVKPLPQRDY